MCHSVRVASTVILSQVSLSTHSNMTAHRRGSNTLYVKVLHLLISALLVLFLVCYKCRGQLSVNYKIWHTSNSLQG